MVCAKIYAPQPGTPLLPAFCTRFLAKHANPLTRTDATLWVPSQRIGDTFREALTHAAGGATTLPRIYTVSYNPDLDAALTFHANENNNPLPMDVVTPLERRLFLARRIRALSNQWSLEQATNAATTLGQLFDTFFDHNLTLADLEAQIPDAFAAHWQKNLLFLQLVFSEYPQWLASQGKCDARQHLHRLLQQQIAQYNAGYTGAVYALGFADTTALGLTLLKSVLDLPQAELWLPPTPIDVLAEPLPMTHPFATTQALLNHLEVPLNTIEVMGDTAPQQTVWDRSFTPANFTHLWQQTPPEGTLENMTLIEAPSAAKEAEVIALIMREVADVPNKTIALVTPNRRLATEVAATLTQWDIRVNDSAGTPLLNTSLGRALGLILTLKRDGVHPQTFAALISHPFIQCPPALALRLDHDILRGLWHGNLWQGYHEKLAETYHHSAPPPALHDLLTHWEAATQPLLTRQSGTLADWLEASLAALIALSHTPETPPEGEEAEQLGQFRSQLFTASDHLGELIASEAIDYLLALLRQYPARLSQHQHPRLFIWGTQEARLQQVDHVILASLNANHWPRGTGQHPWLNPQTMAALNLPSPEVRLGLNAHDFYSLLQSPTITLTRSLRESDHTETTPSPYLSRLLLAFAPQKNALEAMKDRGQAWLNLAHSLNLTAPDVPPSPTPPAIAVPGEEIQPSRWSMSHIRNLLQCPYKAYASRLLTLKELEPYAADPDAADMGNLLHQTLEAFFQQVPLWPAPFGEAVTPYTLDAALTHWQTLSRHALQHMPLATLRALWGPRLVKIGEAVFSQIAEDSPHRQVQYVEKTHIMAGPPDMTARLDRLDNTPQGAVVIDYKTGSIPSWNQLRQGWDPQLMLEGALLVQAGTPVADLEFWALKVKSGGLEVHRYGETHKDLPEQLSQARLKLEDIKAQFTATKASYPATPAGASTLKLDAPCKNCPYQGLCRLHEWYNAEATI